MLIKLVGIPAVPDVNGHRWKIRAIDVDGKSPALAALSEWEASEPQNFKKIITSLRMAQRETRVTNEKYIKKCQNRKLGDVYEAVAYSLEARLMFFYAESEGAIVCTNYCWKPAGGQDTAFSHCAGFKALFEKHYVPESHPPKRSR